MADMPRSQRMAMPFLLHRRRAVTAHLWHSRGGVASLQSPHIIVLLEMLWYVKNESYKHMKSNRWRRRAAALMRWCVTDCPSPELVLLSFALVQKPRGPGEHCVRKWWCRSQGKVVPHEKVGPEVPYLALRRPEWGFPRNFLLNFHQAAFYSEFSS